MPRTKSIKGGRVITTYVPPEERDVRAARILERVTREQMLELAAERRAAKEHTEQAISAMMIAKRALQAARHHTLMAQQHQARVNRTYADADRRYVQEPYYFPSDVEEVD